jgi:hypothetical protein
VVGYYLRHGTASRNYSGVVDTGAATTGTVEGLVSGQTYYFTVTAYNAQRIESEPSGEIAYTVPGPAPATLRIARSDGPGSPPRLQFQVPPTQSYQIQASEDLRSWKKIHTSVSLSTGWIDYVDAQAAQLPKRFYRLALPDGPPVPGWLRLARGEVPSGAVCLRPLVADGQRYQIQASEDLLTWSTLHEGVRTGPPVLDFVDEHAGRYPKRYYRLALLETPLSSARLEIVRGGVLEGSRLQVAALEGQGYRIEASSDMQEWTLLYEAVATSTEPVGLVDPRARLFPQRFYRLAFD